MYSLKKNIYSNQLGVSVGFHVVCPTIKLDFNLKIISGEVHSFVSDKIEDCYIDGKIMPMMAAPFSILNADINDILNQIDKYMIDNIENIVSR